jgi:hypothetical protein
MVNVFLDHLATNANLNAEVIQGSTTKSSFSVPLNMDR